MFIRNSLIQDYVTCLQNHHLINLIIREISVFLESKQDPFFILYPYLQLSLPGRYNNSIRGDLLFWNILTALFK